MSDRKRRAGRKAYQRVFKNLVPQWLEDYPELKEKVESKKFHSRETPENSESL